MGPSSQGNNIAVERYLGSCLISSASRKPKKPPDDCNNLIIKQRQQQQQHYHQQHHQQQQQQQQRHNNNYVVSSEYGNGWTGMPLISMANSRRSNNTGVNKMKHQHHQQQQQEIQHHQQNVERSPLSRLAIHTQGAPLILSGNYGRKNNGKNNTPAPLRIVLPRHPSNRPSSKESLSTPSSPPASSGSDSLSVASDESSGHSENSLPRIIKPRKRRKKERKPSLSTTENETTSTTTTNSGGTNPSIVTLQPYVPLCYEFDKFRQRNNNNNTNKIINKITDKVIGPPASKDNTRNVIATTSTFEDTFEECFEELISSSTICQCRYCDPSGLIWDFDRRCYSPSLTSPISSSAIPSSRLSSLPILRPSSGEYPWFISHESLRRSHSEPSSANLIPPIQRNNIIPVIIKDEILPTDILSSKPIQELEVTSEIVTSLNGHRDIEIKFFLPSSLHNELLSSSNREE